MSGEDERLKAPDGPPSTRDDGPSITIPPIRSFSVREPVHFPSNSNLSMAVNRSRDDLDLPSGKQARSSATITHAISHLESLLEEVDRLAQLVSVPDDKSAQPPSFDPEPKKRRLSDNIASRAARYLETANPRRQPTVRFAENVGQKLQVTNVAPEQTVARNAVSVCTLLHGGTEGTKSALALPVVSAMESASGLEFLTSSNPALKRTKSASHLTMLKLKKSHSSCGSSAHNPLEQEAKGCVRKYLEVPVTVRTTSSPLRLYDNDREPEGKSQGFAPVLKLNGDDLTEKAGNDHWSVIAAFEQPLRSSRTQRFSWMFGVGSRELSIDMAHKGYRKDTIIDLHRRTHVDLFNKPDNFEVYDSCDHRSVARDWPTSRKRFTATVVCINSICLGLLIGIYAGEVPAIQYVIADFSHWAILGNVSLFGGLAISSLLLWPLPLLHGRKPYTLAGLSLALGLQIPQCVVVMEWRLPDVVTWRLILLLCRGLTGFALGLMAINLHTSLLDVFGASLQSRHPHEEVVDPYDVRRHGGGMGLWLAAWSWCTIGPISLGFALGAFIIDSAAVQWGFWASLFVLTLVLLLNLIAPETRRSAFRRTIAEMVGTAGSFCRVTRGEVKMHLTTVGPFWWGEEVFAGLEMCWLMVKQPGFLIMALYSGWVYAQFTLIMMLMGALTSRLYRYRPIWVGLCVLSLGAGAFLAVPFQKASIFSRARKEKARTDSMTFEKPGLWSSHAIRRVVFTVATPLGAVGYACTTWGPPFPVAAPCALAAFVGYFSTLAITECNGLVMEAFDTSDLQPGMTGRPNRRSVVDHYRSQRTNFTCYPRVSAGIAVMQSLGYALAAAATGVGGRIERSIGIMQASSVVAGVLLMLTLLLTLVLKRWKSVRMIPPAPAYNDPGDHRTTRWEPIILGSPSGITRKINLFEAGEQTRFSEIRKKNRLNTGFTSR